MTANTSILGSVSDENMSVVAYKAFMLKRRIILALATEGDCTIADLSRILSVSNPTITKLVGELIQEGYVRDLGKIETGGGRRPCAFGLVSDSGYFLGVTILDDTLCFGVIDLNKNTVTVQKDVPFAYGTNAQFVDNLVERIGEFIAALGGARDKILGMGITVKGRVDAASGVIYNTMNADGFPLARIVTEKTGLETIVENDTRAMTYAEYLSGGSGGVQNALFINVGRGIGVGIIVRGKLYYGKSGFSGEFGHIPFFDNEKICQCGKKGCLETEASGMALETIFAERMREGASSILSDKFLRGETVTMHDIIEAAKNDDVLSIDLITGIGEKLGRGISVLINLFNPELVVIGGPLSEVGDYLMLPIRTALNKYSLRLVTRDTTLRLSSLGDTAGVLGAALLTRNRMLGIL
ncbi:ROK family transcriptional regulator [Rikenella microfusus]|uniref:Making large colonies protein n=1 Tax=Rikenella microfusus TaxID=28139 RepID=A0A379MT79_9BACT|nr:ROK family transcriptional regulator [Rikenella microfusus]SUE34838.1 Making large colonies protein [Rikenella microfusus]HJE88583.1 ROK family protein [Rikenella microfusus]